MVGEGYVPSFWEYSSRLQTLAGRAATPPFFAIREPRQHLLQRLPYDHCAAEVSTVQLDD